MITITTVAKELDSRRWWWVTLLVILGVLLLGSLGRWQLNRLEERRANNAILREQLDAPLVSLNTIPAGTDWATLIDRRVSVQGTFDFDQQNFLRLQSFNGIAGGHLLAPLRISGREEVILVDRGWIPEPERDPQSWPQYDQPGEVTIEGYLQPSRPYRVGTGATAATPAEPQREWFRVDLDAIERQMPYDLLPVYLLAAPTPGGDSEPPLRTEPEFDLSEGPHLSYAIQWFAFALMLSIGYVYYVYRSLRQPEMVGEERPGAP